MKHRSTVVCALIVAALLAAPPAAQQLDGVAEDLAHRAEGALWNAFLSLHAQNLRAGVSLPAASRLNFEAPQRSAQPQASRAAAAADHTGAHAPAQRELARAPRKESAPSLRVPEPGSEVEGLFPEPAPPATLTRLPLEIAAAIPVNGPGNPGVSGVKVAAARTAGRALRGADLELLNAIRLDLSEERATRTIHRFERALRTKVEQAGAKIAREEAQREAKSLASAAAPQVPTNVRHKAKASCPETSGEHQPDASSVQTNASFDSNLDH